MAASTHSRNKRTEAGWPRRAFRHHRDNAALRGIPFLLTFEEWMTVWTDSGRWKQRGCRKGQYVMARFGDRGPYAVGNVKIITAEENHSERDQRGVLNPNAKLTEANVREMRLAFAAGISQSALGRRYGVERHAVGRIVRNEAWVNV